MKRVAAGILIKDGRFLIARRKQDQSHAGLWEFPGGKIEENETPQECLERELKEELGIKVKPGRIIAESEDHSDHGSFAILAVEAEVVDDEFTLKVHDAVKWVSREDLSTYSLAPADRDLLEKIRLGLGTSLPEY
jgi:8-oxo-dGTP diphosphatase